MHISISDDFVPNPFAVIFQKHDVIFQKHDVIFQKHDVVSMKPF